MIFETALVNFVKLLNDRSVDHHKKEGLKFDPTTFEITKGGRKYIKIARLTCGLESQRSVYCFVAKETGDILKAASWKAPAKHARGNIFNEDPLEGTGIHGVRYLNIR